MSLADAETRCLKYLLGNEPDQSLGMPCRSVMLLNSVYSGRDRRKATYTVLGVWFRPTKDAPD